MSLYSDVLTSGSLLTLGYTSPKTNQFLDIIRASLVAVSKESACPMQETQETLVQYLRQGDPPEKEMATHSGILA